MKKDIYLELLKTKAITHMKEIYVGNSDYEVAVQGFIKDDFIRDIQNSTQVSELIGILSDLAFDVPAVLKFVLAIVVEELDDEHFSKNIPTHWDT